MNIGIILVILIFLLLYAGLCFYFGYNAWVWLKKAFSFKYKKTYTIFTILLSTSLLVGMITSWLPIQMIGYYWLVIVGYGLILLPLANLLFYFLKRKGVLWVGLGVLSVYAFILIYGTYNAWSPVVRNYDIAIEKEAKSENLKILMVSDLHLSTIVGKNHLQKLVDIVDETQPDIVLIPGDLIDDNIEPFIEENMDEVMKKIKGPRRVYATLGNHDYYGNDDELLVKTMEKIGIEVLTDESIIIEDEFYIIGRNDPADDTRKETNELVSKLDKTKPLIMLDHQPTELTIAQENGIDILLSGHTHRGQLAPANLITRFLFENDWGYLQKEDLHSFVSSGFGTWGPPLRIGSRSEVFIINVEFK